MVTPLLANWQGLVPEQSQTWAPFDTGLTCQNHLRLWAVPCQDKPASDRKEIEFLASQLILKICGLSTGAAVEAAVHGGAQMIGLVFFEKSPRHVSYEVASELAQFARGLNPDLSVVALTVDADDARIDAIETAVRPDILQLHGSEMPERMVQLRQRTKARLMKAIGLRTAADLAKVTSVAQVSDMLLLDAKPPEGADLPGGNGAVFNWALLDGLDPAALQGRPVLLAGGLGLENVFDAVQLCRTLPHISGLDVSSGVETSPGVKDPRLITDFLARAFGAHVPHTQSYG